MVSHCPATDELVELLNNRLVSFQLKPPSSTPTVTLSLKKRQGHLFLYILIVARTTIMRSNFKNKIFKPESENTIQASFFKWTAMQASAHPELNLFYSIPNGAHKSPASRYLYKVTGLKAGVPDCFLPVARCGFHGLYIEFKSAKGRVSDEQKNWHNALRFQGYAVAICRDWTLASALTMHYITDNKEDFLKMND